MTIATIVLIITGVSGGEGGTGALHQEAGSPEKWLDRLADALKRLAGKAAVELIVIIGSVVGATLSFLGKAVEFVAEHTWALIVFVAGLIGVCLMQRVRGAGGRGGGGGW